MRVYLVQHAEAKREEEDPARPLTEKGRADVRKVSHYAAQFTSIRVDRIVHSGKTRARQTAEVLSEHLRPPRGVQQLEGLAPLDDPKTVADLLASLSEDLMVVGHLPHLGRLAGLLLCGDENRAPVEFKMGGIVALNRTEQGQWSVGWIIAPEILPR